MLALIIGTITEVIFLGICINLTIVLCQKKRPVEDLMARPTFAPPATTPRASQEVRKANENAKGPNIEHTISIKLDNDADKGDMEGPRESMSRDPMTENMPTVQKPKHVTATFTNRNDFEADPDKDVATPPSNLQWDPNKSAKKVTAASPVQKDRSQTKKKQKQQQQQQSKERTVEVDDTQELKVSKEEVLSQKPLSLKSARSGNHPNPKRKSRPKTSTNKSHRMFSQKSMKSLKTHTRETRERRAQSPNCNLKTREDRTKDLDTTQNDEHEVKKENK